MAAKRLWTEAHRPLTLDGYVFQDEQHRAQINKFVQERDIPHLLLTGTQGSGKTTIARILINELEINELDILEENASNKTGVDYIRESILDFASSFPLGKFKVIHLAEFDYMSQAAQGMLRDVMEQNSDTCRFICTGNYEHKIIPALKSRMQHLRFKAPAKDDVLIRMVEILAAENVEFELPNLEKYVDQAYPDIRKIINNLQLNTVNGELKAPSTDSDGNDYQFELLDLLKAGKLQELKDLVLTQCSSEQFEDVYDLIYRNLRKHPGCSNKDVYEQAIVILAEGLYRNGIVAIPHLNFEATVVKMSGVFG